MAARYVSAARSGNEIALIWLMPSDRDERSAIDERSSRYKAVRENDVQIEFVPQSEASYIVGVRFRVRGEPFDEIVLQRIGSRWYLVHLPP